MLIFHSFYCRDIVKEILKHEKWRKCLRNPKLSEGILETTPFRKLINDMPGYILNNLFIIMTQIYTTTMFCHFTLFKALNHD